jgi:hypothetical protein
VIKRLFGILLFFLYLVPSIGINGSLHFCGGELAAIVLIPSDEHPCGCGPDEPMDGGCCQDEAFTFKIKDNHKNVDSQLIPSDLNDIAFAPSLGFNLFEFSIQSSNVEQLISKAKEPPDKKLFILFESYLI